VQQREDGQIASSLWILIVTLEAQRAPAAVNRPAGGEDAVRALWLLVQKGFPGEVYKICSGTGHKIERVLEILVNMTTRPIPVEPDPRRLRGAVAPEV